MSTSNIWLPGRPENSSYVPVSIGNPQSQIRNVVVEVRGFEPLTPWLQTMCSAN